MLWGFHRFKKIMEGRMEEVTFEQGFEVRLIVPSGNSASQLPRTCCKSVTHQNASSKCTETVCVFPYNVALRTALESQLCDTHTTDLLKLLRCCL